MQSIELVRFLAESAAELLESDVRNESDRAERMDEAAELMNLGARILARKESVTTTAIQEAA